MAVTGAARADHLDLGIRKFHEAVAVLPIGCIQPSTDDSERILLLHGDRLLSANLQLNKNVRCQPSNEYQGLEEIAHRPGLVRRSRGTKGAMVIRGGGRVWIGQILAFV